jgi:hypothetical protein
VSGYEINDDEETSKPKAPQARKGEGRMDKADLQSIMHGLLSDAEALVDGELSPKRAQATDYYLGKPFGNESDGRSQFVVTEVRDTIHGMIPSLMRIFTGPDRVVEYQPRKASSVQIAEQATDYAQYVLMEDNAGFLKIRSVLMDGMVRKLGVFKWYWEESTKRSQREEDITQEQLTALAARDDVTLTSIEEDGDDDAKTFTVEYTVKTEGRLCIETLPPEEFIFNRGARDPEEALLLGHRSNKKRGDLLAMGIKEKDLEEHGGESERLDLNVEAVERNATVNTQIKQDPEAGEANDDILYTEAYVYLDVDGDGETELRKICTIGTNHFVVVNEPADERPFALFCPIPEPHTMLGQSIADITMDLQLVKSSIVRSMNDSLALSIFPRMGFLEGFVSVEDLLNTEIGAPIRMRKENAITPVSHPFTGQSAMPVLEYFDGVSENRTGRSKGAMGLDADALQSTTKQGVDASVNATQEQTEMLARIFAEQTLKPLFKGIYRNLVKYKPADRLVKLRGEYVTISTMSWDADMDVTVNVALGTSNVEKRLGAISQIIAEQKEILTTLGPVNPITSLAQYTRALRLATQLAGFRDPSQFFTQVPDGWQPPPQQPQPSPEQILAQTQVQIEQMRMQKDLQIKQAELTLKQQAQAFEQDLKIREMANDFVLRRYQIDAQFKTAFTQANLEADAAQEEAALRGAMDIHQQRHEQTMAEREHALAAQQQDHEQQLAAQQQQHEQELAQQQAAQQAASQSTAE